MRVLFLDFDGVLNSVGYCRAHRGEEEPLLDPVCMEHLRDIVEATSARLVLTTSWRRHWDPDTARCNDIGRAIHRVFAAYGMTVYDKVPDTHRRREDNIRQWLDEHPETIAFAVLDDEFLEAAYLQRCFVRTSSLRHGLDADAASAVRWLLEPPAPAWTTPEALADEVFGSVKTAIADNVLTITLPSFFGEHALCISMHMTDNVWYVHDNGCSLARLRERIADEATFREALVAVCDEGWIVNGAVTGCFAQERQLLYYLQRLIFIAHADLLYRYVEEPLYVFREEDAFVEPDRAEPVDFAAFLRAIRERFTFGYDEHTGLYLAVIDTYANNPTTYSYRFQMFGDTVRLSDRCKGLLEGEILESFYWDHDCLDDYAAFVAPFLSRFGAIMENGNPVLDTHKDDMVKALYAFFQLAHLVSEFGHAIDLP